MKKSILLTPGPTQVPPEVLAAIGEPVLHHRTPQYEKLIAEAIQGLKYVFQTSGDVVIMSSTGTGAMEAAVSNVISQGDKAIVVEGGKFGERWVQLVKTYGGEPLVIKQKWGVPVTADQIAGALKEVPDAKAVYTTLVETSTGTTSPIDKIGELLKDTSTLHVVDAISGLGGQKYCHDDWHVDICVSGSQKGLMLPPGLGFLAISPKAWEVIEQSRSPRYYFNLPKYRKSHAKNQDPYTGSVALMKGLVVATRMIREEGIENLWERHRYLANACRAGVEALGLKLFSEAPADIVTTVWSPQSIDSGVLVKRMRDVYGVGIAGGQADVKGKIFRIAHLGYAVSFDVLIALSVLEQALKDLGYEFNPGSSLKAAQEKLIK